MDPITTLTAVSAALGLVDKIANQLDSLIFSRTEKESVEHSVTTELLQREIIVARHGTSIRKITSDDIENLSEADRKMIEMYEKSMRDTFDIWQAVYPQRNSSADPVVNAKIKKQLSELAKSFCADLGHIFEYLGSIGLELEDHYSDVSYACSQAENA